MEKAAQLSILGETEMLKVLIDIWGLVFVLDMNFINALGSITAIEIL